MVKHHHAYEEKMQHRVVYSIPGMEQTQVQKDILYKTVEDVQLKLDIYYPSHYQRHTPLPAVILVHGDGPAELLKDIKEHEQYRSWGKLIAASGLIAVTANHRSSEGLTNVVGVANDVDDLISYVRDHSQEFHINADTLGLWTCSAGALFALRAALYETPPFIRAVVCYYGFIELQMYYQKLYEHAGKEENNTIAPIFTEEDFDEFSATDLLIHRTAEVPPLFIARAGLDFPELNTALDRFIAEALAQNSMITVMNHPTGAHSFDIQDPDVRSEEIIAATLEFMQTHLLQ